MTDLLAIEALMVPGDDPVLTVAALVNRPRWMLDALCREYPDVEFFPARGEPTAPAKAVCARCQVRAECLDYARSSGALGGHGVWGGLSGRERQRLGRSPMGEAEAA